MNPLVDTDLQTYVRHLIDHNFLPEEDEDNDPAGDSQALHKRSDDMPPSIEEKKGP